MPLEALIGEPHDPDLAALGMDAAGGWRAGARRCRPRESGARSASSAGPAPGPRRSGRSPSAFSQDIGPASCPAHQRKLRGLYVDYADGEPELPGEITEAEARQVIGRAQWMLDRDTGSWAERANQAQ